MATFNNTFICYLNSNSLEVLSTSDNQKIIFPPEVIQHSEVVNKNKFAELLLQFLNQIELKKGKGVIVLSSKIVFSSQINSLDQSVADTAEQFLSSVPLARDNISTITIKNKNYETIYATNRQLYEIIVNTLSQKDIEIYSVIPITAFQDISDTTELNTEAVKNIIDNKQTVTTYNFLQSKLPVEDHSVQGKGEVAINEDTSKSLYKQYIMLSLSLLLLAGAVIYLLLWSETIENPWFKKDLVMTPQVGILPTPTSMPASQLSPTTKPFDKSSLRIQILNGSGVEGQAGKLSQILKESGYKNITTGNALAIANQTTMVYSKQVLPATLKDMENVLKNDLPDIITVEATTSAEYDVVVNTGQEK